MFTLRELFQRDTSILVPFMHRIQFTMSALAMSTVRLCPQAGADPGGRLQHRAAPAPPDRHRYGPEPAGASFVGDLPPDRPSARPLGPNCSIPPRRAGGAGRPGDDRDAPRSPASSCMTTASSDCSTTCCTPVACSGTGRRGNCTNASWLGTASARTTTPSVSFVTT